ncbi:peptidase [Lysinibacillus yapensis]|uniref:Peptidase n=1 Tax=Ureibacillus yapensis TaxID=2304605 RepID=A0A396S2J4_9BACL|nr:PepSY domain-containing protein [Lysinibacillus yapensis]RHW31384.1 peptidase [Lysinibacillus yapensis]
MKKITVILLLVFILGAIVWYGGTKALNRTPAPLSEDKVSQMVIEKYGGTIKNVRPEQENYKLTLKKNQMLYDITVNRRTGEVLSFVKQTSPVTKNRQKPESIEPQKHKEGTPITPEKAKELAAEKVIGTITSIELDEDDGQLVYEIDIDQTKTKKAEVVVNAYSGKIEAITFKTIEDEED